MKMATKVLIGIAVLGLVLIAAFYGWKVLGGIIVSFLAMFGFKKPIEKVKEKTSAKMAKLDSADDPGRAHADNIADQLSKRRSRIDN